VNLVDIAGSYKFILFLDSNHKLKVQQFNDWGGYTDFQMVLEEISFLRRN
jgi:hypothetical protein